MGIVASAARRSTRHSTLSAAATHLPTVHPALAGSSSFLMTEYKYMGIFLVRALPFILSRDRAVPQL